MTTRRDVLRGLTGLVVIGAVPAAACGGGDGDGGRDSSTPMDSSTAMDTSTPMDSSTQDSATPQDSAVDSATGCSQVNHSTNLHNHALTIPVQDVIDGTQKDYLLTTGHTHAITVTAAMFTMLQNGQTVMLTSGGASAGSAHTHNVTLTCA